MSQSVPATAPAAWKPMSGRSAAITPATALFLLIAASLLVRLPDFGHPSFDIDEDFYLLVGDRLLHGALPYVDIWDRKPIGLFLLYAAIRLLGGTGIVQYQLVAAVAAGITAWVIARIARAVTGEGPALFGGLGYLLWIETLGGGGGQSPVFYNLPIAVAAWATWQVVGTPTVDHEASRAWRLSLGAMAAVGIAIQIKYTALFEGTLFGLLLAARFFRTCPPGRALGRSAGLALLAWAPTLAALAFYAANNAAGIFWFANFGSILLREVGDPTAAHGRLLLEAGHLLALAVCCGGSAWWLWRQGDRAARAWVAFMAGWFTAALVGFAAVGAFYYHYALPLFVPLAAGAAPIFARRPLGPVLAALALWLPFANLDYPDIGETRRAQQAMQRLVTHLPADVGRHCLFVFDGPPSLYLLGHACMLSRFVFPDHLASRVEAKAIGIDPVGEVGRILARRPAAIAISETHLSLHNLATFRLVTATLARDYRFAIRVWCDGKWIALYRRK